MKPTRHCHLLFALALGASTAHAALIFNDTFDSGTGSWKKGTSTTGSLTNVGSKLSWSEGVGNSSNMGEAIGRSFTAQTLAVGETIRLTFDFSWTTTGNTNILRAGFFDVTNAITADNWSAGNTIGAWKGYYTFVKDNTNSGNVARRSSSSAASQTAGPTSGGTEVDLTTNTTSYNINDNGTVTYQGLFEVKRTTATTTTTLFTLKEGLTTRFSVTGSTTTLYNTFDTVVLKTGADGPVSVFDNIKVETIPEPAAAALGAFGLLALLRRRRN